MCGGRVLRAERTVQCVKNEGGRGTRLLVGAAGCYAFSSSRAAAGDCPSLRVRVTHGTAPRLKKKKKLRDAFSSVTERAGSRAAGAQPLRVPRLVLPFASHGETESPANRQNDHQPGDARSRDQQR